MSGEIRLIDANVLIRDIMIGGTIRSGKTNVIRQIENAPTIEAEPVIHSYWHDMDKGSRPWCNNCGAEFHVAEWCKSQYLYCPHCGAKMDGEST